MAFARALLGPSVTRRRPATQIQAPLGEPPGRGRPWTLRHRDLLSVRQLSVHYGVVNALEGVDFEVGAGEAVALAGENGAGKSTLVRCIAGDRAPTRGQILMGGTRVPAIPAEVARLGIAVVWQDLALCENLDVAANLLLGGESRRLLLSDTRFHQAAAGLLRDLGIPLPDTTRNVRDLSGGQRQLLAVARAMRERPKLLMLDEPTASLGVNESAQVEQLITELRRQGTSILMACHDIDQMFRLADRIVVLRHGRVVADVEAASTHPDDVIALISGQQVDSSARRQLSRLHGLVDQLSSADPSSSLPLILSALSAALGIAQVSLHLREGSVLRVAPFGRFPAPLRDRWAEIPLSAAGGPIGLAAATGLPVVDSDVTVSATWAPLRHLATEAGVGSSWAVPVIGPDGLTGVITVLRPERGHPGRDELDLVTLYAGYVASAIERDGLLAESVARNRVLETIREVLETLAGPVPLTDGLVVALRALRQGLQAEVAGLVDLAADAPSYRAVVGATTGEAAGRSEPGALAYPPEARDLLAAAAKLQVMARSDGHAHDLETAGRGRVSAVTFSSPGGPTALVAQWATGVVPADSTALMEDAANSLRLALEREDSERAHQEAAALRRSRELQQQFLSRLSHELRTPLTAIRGYASSLLQPDVVWDGDSQHRFLSRMAAESSRLGRLVDDLLDFSAIESGTLRLQPDWCDPMLVIEAAVACLPPASASHVEITSQPGLPVVWADHDRLEQVFVNLMDNAIRHNPPGTHVWVRAAADSSTTVVIDVVDDGFGVPGVPAGTEFDSGRRRTATTGAGLGLSITKGIIDAHGGHISLERLEAGTRFRIRLPTELLAGQGLDDVAEGPD